MRRELKILPAAERELRDLEEEIRKEAIEVVSELVDDPCPPDAVELRGQDEYYRIPFYRGQYRIVYKVRPKAVLVTRIRARSDAYRGLFP